jgi:hypothetical protein
MGSALAQENFFEAMALVHPSLWQPEDADDITVPVALLPSKGEDKDVMDEFWNRIQKKPFASKCVRQDFVRTFLVFGIHQSSLRAHSSWTFTMASHRHDRTGLTQNLLGEQRRLMRLWPIFSKSTCKGRSYAVTMRRAIDIPARPDISTENYNHHN